jgi:outer membrane protein assembly factor BamB
LLWSAEPGGTLDAPIAIGEKAVYIVSEKMKTAEAGADGSLRALDPATGVTLWARDYERPFTSPIATLGDRLYAGSADGSL